VTGPTRGQQRALVLLALLSVVLITVDARGDSFAGLRSAARSVLDPAQDGVTTLVAPVGRFVGGLGDLNDSRRRIDELEAQNAELRRRLREGELTGARAEELRRLALLAGQGQFSVVPATVTGLGPALGFEWAVTVDAGRRDGIRPDMTVVNADGLVGRVKDVTDSSAVVVLAVDPGSSVGVRLAGGRQLGLASGNGLGPLTFTPLDPQTRVKVGDRLVTGPYGGSTYVAGLPVGEVTAVSGDPGAPAREATVRPYVGFSSLDLVGVLVGVPRTDPRDRLAPTGPTTPSPSGTPTPGGTPTPSGTP
jgi:rod shape-determining protein MreC